LIRILYAAYSAIFPAFYLLLIQLMDAFLCVFPSELLSLTLSPLEIYFTTAFWLNKIVQINSLGGAIILFTAYSAIGRIYVRFFLENSAPKFFI